MAQLNSLISDDEWEELSKQFQNAAKKWTAVQSFSILSSSPTADGSPYSEYHTPEQDEQGTFYGYKYLSWDGEIFHSPSYRCPWMDGELAADIRPGMGHMHGIHFTKRMNHPALDEYAREEAFVRTRIRVLVKCALSGTIVETEQGFRAEHAQIIGVLYNGNWKTYQDYRECARPDSRPNPWEEGRSSKWITGNWQVSWDWSPDDDSNP